jgi:hypothetical protein
MGQFESETDAALTQLKYETLSETPGMEFVEIIGDLIKLIGTGGIIGLTGGISSLALKVRKLAGASYGSNLIYAITAVRNDLTTLFESHKELHEHIEALPTNPIFAEAISGLALRAMHTSAKDRLKRLAHIVVNGVKENDLEPESLDDMMRAAVELTEHDISVLSSIYKMQNHLFSHQEIHKEYRWRVYAIRSLWEEFWKNQAFSNYQGINGLAFNSSCARLQSAGLIASIGTKSILEGPTMHDYELLPEGKKFFERLQEIAVQQ